MVFTTALSDPRAGWNLRIETDERWLATVGARGEDHAVRLDPHQLGRFEIEHHHDRATHELLGFVGFGDPGHERPLLAAGVDRQLYQLARIRHLLGREDFRYAQVDFHEVVDRNP